jgi:putative ABC transport system substrate-binding protein
MPVIGYLSGGSGPGPDDDGFGQGLAEGGYVLGRNLNIEYRWAEGKFDRLPALAADLTSRGVVLIATATLPAAMVAKAATPTTPVVFVIGEDPVEAGLVASLNRPGGNATGVSDFVNQLVAKALGPPSTSSARYRIDWTARQPQQSQCRARCERGSGSREGSWSEVAGREGD